MSKSKEFYLVRHGSYDRSTGRLDPTGREVHAPSARDELIARGVGSNALLLSSDALRAAETAEIIGEGIGVDPILSEMINQAGNRAWNVQDLDAVVDEALENAGVVQDGRELVVVTHAPMLAIARRARDVNDISFGEVFAYERGSWHNPDFRK